MATRLRVKKKKMAKDRKASYSKNKKPTSHKIDRARSLKAKAKKINTPT